MTQVEFRDVGRLPESERVETGDLVCAKTIGIDQLQHLDLLVRGVGRLRGAFAGRNRRRARMVRQTAEFLAYAGMGDVLRHTVDARQTFEIISPGRCHRGGILQILLVEIFEVSGVTVRQR